MTAAIAAFDEEVFVSLKILNRHPSYAVRNVLAGRLGRSQQSVPVAKVLRSLKRLEAAGRVKRDTHDLPRGHQYVWEIVR